MKDMEDKYVLIGKRIRDAREASGWSQKQLADTLGFESATAISLIESGSRRVTVEVLEKIADLLHQDIGYFLGRSQPKVDLQYALRAEKNLTNNDRKEILNFVDFVKKRKNAKR